MKLKILFTLIKFLLNLNMVITSNTEDFIDMEIEKYKQIYEEVLNIQDIIKDTNIVNTINILELKKEAKLLEKVNTLLEKIEILDKEIYYCSIKKNSGEGAHQYHIEKEQICKELYKYYEPLSKRYRFDDFPNLNKLLEVKLYNFNKNKDIEIGFLEIKKINLENKKKLNNIYSKFHSIENIEEQIKSFYEKKIKYLEKEMI